GIRTGIREKIQSAAKGDRPAIVSGYLRQQIAVVLGVSVTSLTDEHSSFVDLGLDSLTAVELRNRLQTGLGCTLPVTLVYDRPTIVAMRDFLLQTLQPDASNKAVTVAEDTSQAERPSTVQDVEALTETEAESRLLAELERMDF
ncbi:MAG: acyl carrier protein, partial [Cyanobacteria bacterium J06607_13]